MSERIPLPLGRWVALLTWLGTAALVLALQRAQPERLTFGSSVLAWGAYLTFGAAYLVESDLRSTRRQRVWMCVLMSLTSLIFNAVFSRLDHFTALPLQIISAMIISQVVSPRIMFAWVTLQALGLAIANAEGQTVIFSVALFFGYALLQLTAAHITYLMVNERQLRTQLGQAQAQLAALSQEAERLRIARDLHDALGHQLTALGLELEYLAQTAPDGHWRESAVRARQLTRAAQAELRLTVGALRGSGPFDLAAALRQLGEQAPGIRLHLDLPQQWPALDASSEQTLLRCAQEAVTNTLRHADARQIWLSVQLEGGALVLRVHDDGLALTDMTEGHGLIGMRERLAAHGGALQLARTARGALQLEARLPLSVPV